jgi:hypothetical protein
MSQSAWLIDSLSQSAWLIDSLKEVQNEAWICKCHFRR